ncbi:hypothetical protein AB0D33_09405 [Streptomyces sp. NPDC048404]|uniref:hypothetical protein n=1 Tax=unclassified Streptomyces TaxID=2593676 RepID=UPI00343096B2
MNRGEQTPEPTTEDAAPPANPTDPGTPGSSGDASGRLPRFAVVISGDGSAAIDGEPVPSADGTPVDAAILDTLHGYARDRGTTVTATVSDPSAGYVACVEVAPDGSSTLVDQREEREAPPTATEAEAERNDLAYHEDDEGEGDGDAPHANPDPDPYSSPYSAPYSAPHDEDPEFHEAPSPAAGFGTPDSSGTPDGSGTPAGSRSPLARPAPQPARRPGARQSDDEYAGPGLLHRPLVVGPVALVAAALVIVPLAMLGSGGSGDGGHRTEAARSADGTSESPQAGRSGPVSTSTVSVPPPSPSASPSAGPKESKGAKGTKGSGTAKGTKGSGTAKGPGNGAGAVVTVTATPPRATVTAKPAQDTAATAVSRLARDDPSGRHICYRAYVSGQGWQKPVCDGTMAGTSGRNHPVKALNIAVSGSGGSAANAFVQDPGSSDGRGKWEPRWTAVIADGRNNYIGSTKSGAPAMSGFAINIGSGRICRTTKVHGFDWGAQECADARPGFVFGGALENDRWLEAVKFTV